MTYTLDAKRNNLIKKHRSVSTIDTDVLIIGAGLAGLSAALALPKSLSITVLSKAALEVCSSHYAQGGIAASLAADDSVDDHIADTLVAGAGLCAADNTASILGAGQQAVEWLCEQGVPFTLTDKILRTNDSSSLLANPKYSLADLHLTKEGGHGCRRVAHADDATGRHVMEALTVKVQAANNITILEFHEALHLLTSASDTENATENSRCQGASVFDHKGQRQLNIYSKAVVMASGGLGQLFARASAPNVCVGDGVMMAWQVGCRLANLEFVQFHPTGLALEDSSFLISEALRGEGGRLYCPATGKRFMLAIDERAELAPRDIVARAIAEQISHNGLGYVHLDVSHLPSDFIIEHFPQIYQTVLQLGIDITTDPIPVAPTAHYSCGGIVTNASGLSDLTGLYAAGEVAYTGLHGANRLASNSLLECIVVGRKIAEHLPNYLLNNQWASTEISNSQLVTLPQEHDFNALAKLNNTNKKASTDVEENGNDSDTLNLTLISRQLKSLMTSNMGIVRDANSLGQALLQIQQWQKDLVTLKSSDNDHLAENEALITSENISVFQLLCQLQLATLIIQAALQRHESRGGHYRVDYPLLVETPLVSVILPCVDNSGFNNTVKNHQHFERNHNFFAQNKNSRPILSLV